MNRNAISPPRLLPLLIAAALLGSLTVHAPEAPAAPKRCPQGKTAWKLEGRSVCVARARLGSGEGSTSAAMAEAWILNASKALPGGRMRLAPSLRRAVPRLARRTAAAVADAGSPHGSARVAQRGQIVQRMDKVVGQKDLGNGVVGEVRIRGRAFEDDSQEFDLEIETRDKEGNAVRYSPDLRGLSTHDRPVDCPTAAGVVTADAHSSSGGSVVKLRGKRVLEAKTVRHDWSVEARGQVGTDARLHSVAADVVAEIRIFERGVQFKAVVRAPVSLSRDGAPQVDGTPSVTVSIRAADASPAQEREAEASFAREFARAPQIARMVGNAAGYARDRLLTAESAWYHPNQCARIAWSPNGGITLDPGETRGVTAKVFSTGSGGEATGSIALGVSHGRLIPITSTFSPAGPASFIAAGGAPDSEGYTVYASAIATSTAGRAQATWFADAAPAEVPQSFQGTVESTSSTDGLTRVFSGSATYTRTSLVRGRDGSLTAWYELTSASLAEAKETLGATQGCRYEAIGSGGYIDSGDLELRVLPSGEVVYALLYDLRVESQYVPTDCPPGGSPFDGEISAFLNARRPGPVEDQLRPAGDGYLLEEEQVHDVTGVPGGTTTASWSLAPE